MASSTGPRQVITFIIELGEGPTAKKVTLLFTAFIRSPEDFSSWNDDFKSTLATAGTELTKALEEDGHKHSATVRMLIKATVDRSLIESFAPSGLTAAALYKKMAALSLGRRTP